jgi:AsmA protein
MKTFLRRLLIFFVLLFVALAVLVFTLNPNYLKPVIEEQVAKRGLRLTLEGDLKWQFFPSLGIGLGALKLDTQDQKNTLLTVQEAQLTLQWGPLLRRQMQVSGLILKGVKAHYHLDAQGKSAWDALAAAPSTSSESSASQNSAADIHIEAIDLQALEVDYKNAQAGDAGHFLIHRFNAEKLNLNGAAFPVKLDVQMQWKKQPPMQLKWQSDVKFNMDEYHFILENSNFNFTLGEAEVPFTFSTDVHWQPKLVAKGAITLPKQSFAPLAKSLAMASDVLPQELGASFNYDFNEDQLMVGDLKLLVDDSQFDGQLSLTEFNRALPRLQLQLQGDTVRLERYMGGSSDADPSVPAASVETAPPTPLPMELLRQLHLQADFKLAKAFYKELEITEPQLKLSAQQGLIKLESLHLTAAEGVIEGDGQLDARAQEAQLALQLKSSDLNLGLLLKTLAQFEKVTGHASAQAQLLSSGNTTTALSDQLTATVRAQSEELSLVPMNIEEQFCKAMALLQQTPLPTDLSWPAQTRLTPIQIYLEYAQHKLMLKDVNAQIARLTSKVGGQLDTETGQFKIPIEISLHQFAEGDQGCLPIDPKWRQRSIPLICKGNLNSIDAKTCLPDTSALGDLLKDKLKVKAQQAAEVQKDRLEKKLGEQAKDKLREKFGDEKLKATEDSVRNLLKSFKKSKSSSSLDSVSSSSAAL